MGRRPRTKHITVYTSYDDNKPNPFLPYLGTFLWWAAIGIGLLAFLNGPYAALFATILVAGYIIAMLVMG